MIASSTSLRCTKQIDNTLWKYCNILKLKLPLMKLAKSKLVYKGKLDHINLESPHIKHTSKLNLINNVREKSDLKKQANFYEV